MNTLLLDWSGTLVDDFTPTVDATNHVFRHFGHEEWSKDEFRERFYLPYPKFYKKELPDVPLQELEQVFQRAFRENNNTVSLLAPTYQFLHWAYNYGLKLIIFTSMDASNFAQQAEDLKVSPFFTDIYAGVLNKCDTIPQIIKTHNLEPRQTGFVGDMVHDLRAAHVAGVHPIAVLTGYDSALTLAQENPSFLINDIGKLKGIIESFQASLPSKK